MENLRLFCDRQQFVTSCARPINILHPQKHNRKDFFFHIELNAPPPLKFMGSTFSCHVDLHMEGEKINIYPPMAVRDTRKKRLRFKNILNVT